MKKLFYQTITIIVTIIAMIVLVLFGNRPLEIAFNVLWATSSVTLFILGFTEIGTGLLIAEIICQRVRVIITRSQLEDVAKAFSK